MADGVIADETAVALFVVDVVLLVVVCVVAVEVEVCLEVDADTAPTEKMLTSIKARTVALTNRLTVGLR